MRLALLLLFLVTTNVVRAELQEIASSLTLDQVVTDVLQNNPQIHALRARWESRHERPIQERALPNPMLQYSAMDMVDGGHWPDTGEKRVMLQQQFPWFGKLGLKGRAAEKEAEAARQEYEAFRLEIVMQARQTYFELYGLQQSLVLARQETGVLAEMVKISETAYATGTQPQSDILQSQTEAVMLKQKCIELEAQTARRKARLNQFMNRSADSPLGLAMTAPADIPPTEITQLLQQAQKLRPEIQKARAEIQRDEFLRDTMKKDRFPDYRLGVEYRNVGVDFSNFSRSDNMLMVTIGVDLPLWHSRNQAGIREAEKQMESSQAGLDAAVRQTSFDVQDAWLKFQAARQTLDLYRKELIPQADARYESVNAGYRAGKTAFRDWLETERARLQAHLLTAQAESQVGIELAGLERAVGADLISTSEGKP